jgi:hypothetical protein
MAVTPASFRAQFPEFADPGVFSDTAIENWTTIALLLLDPCRWNTLLDYGTSLYIAHRLSLSARDILRANAGGIPGQTPGLLTAKAVDKASAGYDVSKVALDGAGEYNATRYGVELWKLMGQMGAGGAQVNSVGPVGLGPFYGFGG